MWSRPLSRPRRSRRPRRTVRPLRIEPLEARTLMSVMSHFFAVPLPDSESAGTIIERDHAGRADLMARAAAASSSTATPIMGDVVPAGFDLFETDPKPTKVRFQGPLAIPADFFAPASNPFQGKVKLAGEPLGSFAGSVTGTRDTIVQRKDPATLPAPFPSSDTIDTELVALCLYSVKPIKVQVGGMTQLWNVEVSPSPTKPSPGTLTIIRRHANGGTFDSELTIYPLLRFIRQSDGLTKLLDVGTLPLTPTDASSLTLTAQGVPWIDTCPAPLWVVAGFNDQFCASATASG